ncbi:Por secretion system C-terminal sorting domain-containing protein [Chryseobacterium arachidis]|uniref:Por secretion system C-terminal sorting domain-containing protein n=1 Tax=Chryseobacterium arachidis TaxID=1416778 RepID=A0A1M5IPB0_9FLAO|nr:T9SS type A sorting domain-containing protein [Chryseobacterium arachidis]SHG30127.1 Por secretion system C-terminal sorting domain-containing protein [Chryseobacterium arachidis]
MAKIRFFKKKTRIAAFSLLMFFLSLNVNAQCSLTGWSKLAQGENFSIALKQDGTLWIWGRNLYGILGDGTGAHTQIQHPTQIGTDNNWTDISVGRYFALGKKANGDLYGWGANDYGQLGLGNNTNVFTPTLIQQNVTAFSAGYFHTLVVKADGTLWGTGYNDWSGLGVGTSVGWYNTFQQESSQATNWASVLGTYYNSFAIKTDGTLWSAGANVEGQTGLGTPASLGTNETANFTQIGTDTNWKSVAGGIYHTLGLKTNGELWSWGHNNNGRLGLGTTGGIQYTPQQVAGNTWASIGATNEASSAIKTDGSFWTWGNGSYGVLGQGTPYSGAVNVPTQVGTDTNWQSIPVRSGEVSAGGIKADSTLWSWGWDTYWQLGNGDGVAAEKGSPTQVTCVDNAVLAVNDNIISQKKTSLYPNPAKDIVTLQSEKAISEVKIYNVAGSLVKSFSKPSDNTINISELSAGVYFVKINDSVESIKLIKK